MTALADRLLTGTVKYHDFMEIRRLAREDGSNISELRPDGTVVLRRPDLSVGSMPGVLYVVKVGNAALNFNRYAPSLVSGLEG
jgi:hypothetical protein